MLRQSLFSVIHSITLFSKPGIVRRLRSSKHGGIENTCLRTIMYMHMMHAILLRLRAQYSILTLTHILILRNKYIWPTGKSWKYQMPHTSTCTLHIVIVCMSLNVVMINFHLEY